MFLGSWWHVNFAAFVKSDWVMKQQTKTNWNWKLTIFFTKMLFEAEDWIGTSLRQPDLNLLMLSHIGHCYAIFCLGNLKYGFRNSFDVGQHNTLSVLFSGNRFKRFQWFLFKKLVQSQPSLVRGQTLGRQIYVFVDIIFCLEAEIQSGYRGFKHLEFLLGCDFCDFPCTSSFPPVQLDLT